MRGGILAVATAMLAACIAGGALAQSSAEAAPSQPERNYANACGTCHAGREFGVQVLADRLGAEGALIHERNNLSPDAIRFIVRNGFGAMPAMSKVEVSDAELDRIIAHLGEARTPVRPR